ncbi:MAG: ABC transporter ATP-binding protein [Firmicutes bacterium]|nr:ABC transporter ATP-binding protein [Bacillota bacterium]
MATLLSTTDLTAQFGGLTAVDRVNLTVEEGSVTGLIGPNGAGKTTAFNMISGFLTPTSGSVNFAGREITGHAPHRLAKLGMSRTFQHTSIFANLTVRENILVGMHLKIDQPFFRTLTGRIKPVDEDAVREILNLLELADRAKIQAGSLPYGDQRKLEIAIALAVGPRLLLLDEPAAGMNPEEAMRLVGVIRMIQKRDITVLLVEHNMRLVMGVCDRIHVLEHGRKIAEGTPAEIAANPRVIEVYLGKGQANA